MVKVNGELIGHFVTITSECSFCKETGATFEMTTTGISYYRALDIVESHAKGMMSHHESRHHDLYLKILMNELTAIK